MPRPFVPPSALRYDRRRLDEGDIGYAAVPFAAREGGIRLALPAAVRTADTLALAEADACSGLLGPFKVVDAPLRGAASRALTSTASVLVIDLEVGELELESL